MADRIETARRLYERKKRAECTRNEDALLAEVAALQAEAKDLYLDVVLGPAKRREQERRQAAALERNGRRIDALCRALLRQMG